MTIHANVAPLRATFLERVRGEGRDDLDQQVKRVTAADGEPCRDVLRRAEPGEELILASHSPFTVAGPYREFGPIFVLANHSRETVRRDVLHAGSERDYLRERFVIRAYSRDEEIVDASLVGASGAQEVVERFFARADVSFLHVRFPAYGCFACRLDQPNADL